MQTTLNNFGRARLLDSIRSEVRVIAAIGDEIWVVEKDGSLCIRSARTLEVAHYFPAAKDKKDQFANCISMVGDTVWAGFTDGYVHVYDQRTKELLQQFAPDETDKPGEIVSMVAHNLKVYTAGVDCNVYQWDARTTQLQRVFKGHNTVIRCLCCVGALLYSGDDDGVLKAWDVKTGATVQSISVGKSGVMALLKHSNRLWIGTGKGKIKLADTKNVQNFHISKELTGHTQRITCFGNCNTMVLSGAADKTVCVWAASTFQLLQKIDDHNGFIVGITPVYKQDTWTLLTTGRDKLLKLWELEGFHVNSYQLEDQKLSRLQDMYELTLKDVCNMEDKILLQQKNIRYKDELLADFEEFQLTLDKRIQALKDEHNEQLGQVSFQHAVYILSEVEEVQHRTSLQMQEEYQWAEIQFQSHHEVSTIQHVLTCNQFVTSGKLQEQCISRLKNENDVKEKEIAMLEDENQKLKNTISDMSDDRKQFEQDVQKKMEEYNTARTQLSKLNNRLMEKTMEIEHLNTVIEGHLGTIEGKTAQIKELNQTLEQHEKDTENKSREVNELSVKIMGKEQVINDMTLEKERLKSTNDNMTAKLKRLQDQYTERNADIERMSKSQTEELQRIITEKSDEISQLAEEKNREIEQELQEREIMSSSLQKKNTELLFEKSKMAERVAVLEAEVKNSPKKAQFKANRKVFMESHTQTSLEDNSGSEAEETVQISIYDDLKEKYLKLEGDHFTIERDLRSTTQCNEDISTRLQLLTEERDRLRKLLDTKDLGISDIVASEHKLKLELHEMQLQYEESERKYKELEEQTTLFQFIISSRGELVVCLWSMHGHISSVKRKVKETEKQLFRKSHKFNTMDDCIEFKNKTEDCLTNITGHLKTLTDKNNYIIANYLTEYEKLHLGVSPHFFYPDNTRPPVVGDKLYSKLKEVSLAKRYSTAGHHQVGPHFPTPNLDNVENPNFVEPIVTPQWKTAIPGHNKDSSSETDTGSNVAPQLPSSINFSTSPVITASSSTSGTPHPLSHPTVGGTTAVICVPGTRSTSPASPPNSPTPPPIHTTGRSNIVAEIPKIPTKTDTMPRANIVEKKERRFQFSLGAKVHIPTNKERQKEAAKLIKKETKVAQRKAKKLHRQRLQDDDSDAHQQQQDSHDKSTDREEFEVVNVPLKPVKKKAKKKAKAKAPPKRSTTPSLHVARRTSSVSPPPKPSKIRSKSATSSPKPVIMDTKRPTTGKRTSSPPLAIIPKMDARLNPTATGSHAHTHKESTKINATHPPAKPPPAVPPKTIEPRNESKTNSSRMLPPPLPPKALQAEEGQTEEQNKDTPEANKDLPEEKSRKESAPQRPPPLDDVPDLNNTTNVSTTNPDISAISATSVLEGINKAHEAHQQ